MKKSLLNVTSGSIKQWAYQKSEIEPLPDWNELIATIENGELLLTLASDANCPKRAYILKCLYLLVGTSVSKHHEADIARIQVLLTTGTASQDQIILNWVNRSRVILRDLRKYDYVEWCMGGFAEKDISQLQQKN